MTLQIVESNRRTHVVVFQDSDTGLKVAYTVQRFDVKTPEPTRQELDAVNTLVIARSQPQPRPVYSTTPMPIVRIRGV